MARFVMPIEQVVNDDASDVGGSWQLFFYDTGTTTFKDTFSDSALTTANANPVVADAAGRFGDIFLESGTYKVALKDADDVEKWTADPVEGTIGSSGAIRSTSISETLTVSDATKLIDVDTSGGAKTITLLPAATAGNGFEVGVRKNGTDTNAVTTDADGAETINGTATRALYRDGETEWYRTNGTAWFVVRKFIDPAKGTDIASAATTNLATATGNYVDITGTTTITALGTAPAGTVRTVQFDGILTLTHNGTSLILPGAANIITAAGDVAEFTSLGSSNWKCTDYQRASGAALALPRSHGAGCILSKDADTAHDINVTAGAWRNADEDGDLILASEITKQIDATWAAGDDAGGLSSSLTAPANNTTYHVFLIEVAGVVDVGFDTSVVAANLIADHSATAYRRIGSRRTDGSANIRQMLQRGNNNWYDTAIDDFNNGSIATSFGNHTLSVPLGIVTTAIFAVSVANATSFTFVPPGQTGGGAPNATDPPVGTGGSAGVANNANVQYVDTNTSSQVAGAGDAAFATMDITTYGWIDRRGRDA